MNIRNSDYCRRPEVGQVQWLNDEIAEVSLLLPGWQVALLQNLASSRRLTLGQLLRQFIGDAHASEGNAGSPVESTVAAALADLVLGSESGFGAEARYIAGS